jgi:hypothetical protein
LQNARLASARRRSIAAHDGRALQARQIPRVQPVLSGQSDVAGSDALTSSRDERMSRRGTRQHEESVVFDVIATRSHQRRAPARSRRDSSANSDYDETNQGSTRRSPRRRNVNESLSPANASVHRPRRATLTTRSALEGNATSVHGNEPRENKKPKRTPRRSYSSDSDDEVTDKSASSNQESVVQEESSSDSDSMDLKPPPTLTRATAKNGVSNGTTNRRRNGRSDVPELRGSKRRAAATTYADPSSSEFDDAASEEASRDLSITAKQPAAKRTKNGKTDARL